MSQVANTIANVLKFTAMRLPGNDEYGAKSHSREGGNPEKQT
jgi:hypothetical protein